jgi:hypothetical protein
MKTNLIIGAIIIALFLFLLTCESSVCKQFKPVYNKEINGKILKRNYIFTGGRTAGYIEILDIDNEKYTFDYFDLNKEVFDVIEAGDSVSKSIYSTKFKFYRHGELLGVIDFQCAPPDTLK